MLFCVGAWKFIHQNIEQNRFVLNLADVDCLRQARIKVYIF